VSVTWRAVWGRPYLAARAGNGSTLRILISAVHSDLREAWPQPETLNLNPETKILISAVHSDLREARPYRQQCVTSSGVSSRRVCTGTPVHYAQTVRLSCNRRRVQRPWRPKPWVHRSWVHRCTMGKQSG
jgi:hypothetical protein